ncbi:transcriptional repressor [Pseudofrankia sp. DC12]|uniref:Fur family transcriptional regulator n=1 Tax=Pseudofrankia sp. DC12 TaxID=683315 RepID=UPI0005F7A140|nr:transcriptional repressor [Pseudofrankia sp. DC12]
MSDTPPAAAAGQPARRGPGLGTATRATRQGAAIAALLAGTPVFTTAQDLHTRLRQQGQPVGLTTVYRHLQVLADAGQIDVVRTPEGENLYRRCSTQDHHHHLVCRTCGRTVEIDTTEIETWTTRVATAEGFTDLDHTLEIYGTCATCATG